MRLARTPPDAFPSRRPLSVLDRTRLHAQRAVRAWSIGIALTVLGLTAMYTSVSGNDALTKALEGYPKALQKLFSMSDFTSGAGYLRAELFSFTVPLLLFIPAILWGSGALGDEESHGTIDLLLAAPISRRRVVLETWAGVAIDLVILGATLGVALVIGCAAFSVHVAVANLVAATVATTLLAVLFASIAQAAVAATGHTGVARGITAAVAVISYLLSSLAALVDAMRPFQPLSPWYHALGVDPVGTGFRLWHLGLLVGLIAIMVAVADRTYERRDLGT
ncbi:MAG: ABC transporter permease subunit [Acidimicrobiales bacterium]